MATKKDMVNSVHNYYSMKAIKFFFSNAGLNLSWFIGRSSREGWAPASVEQIMGA